MLIEILRLSHLSIKKSSTTSVRRICKPLSWKVILCRCGLITRVRTLGLQIRCFFRINHVVYCIDSTNHWMGDNWSSGSYSASRGTENVTYSFAAKHLRNKITLCYIKFCWRLDNWNTFPCENNSDIQSSFINRKTTFVTAFVILINYIKYQSKFYF